MELGGLILTSGLLLYQNTFFHVSHHRYFLVLSFGVENWRLYGPLIYFKIYTGNRYLIESYRMGNENYEGVSGMDYGDGSMEGSSLGSEKCTQS